MIIKWGKVTRKATMMGNARGIHRDSNVNATKREQPMDITFDVHTKGKYDD
jgi:hypothetical protein